jgi:hypothetical protein
MTAASAVVAAIPSKVRSKITNDPAQRHGRSAEARRVRDLFAAYSTTLGNPTDVGTQALILAAAEAVTIAEVTRAVHLAGKGDLDSVVRSEGTAARALRRLGLDRAVAPPKKSFAEKLEEMEATRKAAEAAPAADAAKGDDVAADAGQLTSVPGNEAGVRAMTISPDGYDVIKQLGSNRNNRAVGDGKTVGDGSK